MMDGVISVSQKHERLSGVLWCPTAWISCLVLWWCAWNPDELTYCSSHSIQHGGPLNTLHIRLNTLVFALIASEFYFTLLKAIPRSAMPKAMALITKNNLIYFTSLRNAAQKRLIRVPPVLTIFRSVLLAWRSWDCVVLRTVTCERINFSCCTAGIQ